MAVLRKFITGLKKTRENFTRRVDNLFRRNKIDEEFFEELEEILISGDVGVELTLKLVEEIREYVRENRVTDTAEIKMFLKEILVARMSNEQGLLLAEKSPTVILVLGVNGTGKTTTIGKLAYKFRKEGKKVILGAGDTFRAAAIEQLTVWADRAEVDIVAHKTGADPGAVVFDAINAAVARHADIVLCDTAGRLHTKLNLMEELKKISRVAAKVCPGAPHETLLVLDATTGQNAIAQAEVFSQAAGVTGLVLAKLDGTSRGGIAVAVRDKLNIPVKFIGTGEKREDLHSFDAEEFVEALLNI